MSEKQGNGRKTNSNGKPFEKKEGFRKGASGQGRKGVSKREGAANARHYDPRKGAPSDGRAKRGDARLVALKALYDVYYANSYSNLALDRQLKDCALSPEDRRLATNIFYQCVENRRKIDYMLAPFVKTEPEQIITCILHVASAQIMFLDRVPPFAAVNEAVNEARLYKRDEAAGFVNVVLRNLIRAKESGEVRFPERGDDPLKYLEIEYSSSTDAVGLLTEAFGMEEAERILAYKPAERYETIRPNLLRSSDRQLEERLNALGLEWKPSPVKHGYYVKNAGNLAASEDYLKGFISIQGVSAMLAAMALEPKRGMTVLDACAAPGGKAALICELMQGSGRVYAWDLHEHRVEMMKLNGKRLGLDNLRCAVRDATVLKEDMTRAMDAVIIDAPCTGLGVMSDKPDIKYHLTRARLGEITDTQRRLLDSCCEYVKPGGRLVYSTCTLLPQENDEQVKAFLLRHPEFKLEKDDGWLPETFRDRCSEGMLSLMEHRDGVEGFFIARLKRVL